MGKIRSELLQRMSKMDERENRNVLRMAAVFLCPLWCLKNINHAWECLL